jgi:hypothetical protein
MRMAEAKQTEMTFPKLQLPDFNTPHPDINYVLPEVSHAAEAGWLSGGAESSCF